MEQVLGFFRRLFDTADWPPRWHCGHWTEFHGWLYIVSDLLIWSAYFAIPLTILKYISRRTETQFLRAYFLFAGFILACGSTHLLDAIAFWFPAYRLNALVRLVTGVVSWITVFHLVRILPAATSMRSRAELEKEIAERKKVEEELKVLNQQLNASQEIAKLGHWQWEVPSNKVSWSDELYKIYKLSHDGELSYESYLQKVHPEDRELVNSVVQRAFAEKNFPTYTHRILLDDGKEKILQAKGEVQVDENGKVIRMIGTAQDITETQRSQQQLIERTHALETTNADLERFAYVASHDLREPLRKIMTFTSLLEKEIGADGQEKASVYMDKIRQSSSRMQRLIDDILAFSSLRGVAEAFRQTDLNEVIGQVLSDLEFRIEATGATIKVVNLPTLDAVPSQMGQLFQNLIGNALKFRKETEPPVVNITSGLIDISGLNDYGWANAEMLSATGYRWSREQFVRIDVADNGIGFEEAYAEKIFEIFQRLHNHKSYEGTGIGLAVCKKIVDNHHGMISAKSLPGQGAVFTVILPLSQKYFLTENRPSIK